MRAFSILYATDLKHCFITRRKSLVNVRQAFTVLSSVCSYWHQTLIGWPDSPTRHWVKHTLEKLVERK